MCSQAEPSCVLPPDEWPQAVSDHIQCPHLCFFPDEGLSQTFCREYGGLGAVLTDAAEGLGASSDHLQCPLQCLLKQFAVTKEALVLFSQVPQRGLVPEAFTYSVLFSACSNLLQ
jgi:hypothetical protein